MLVGRNILRPRWSVQPPSKYGWQKLSQCVMPSLPPSPHSPSLSHAQSHSLMLSMVIIYLVSAPIQHLTEQPKYGCEIYGYIRRDNAVGSTARPFSKNPKIVFIYIHHDHGTDRRYIKNIHGKRHIQYIYILFSSAFSAAIANLPCCLSDLFCNWLREFGFDQKTVLSRALRWIRNAKYK